MDSLGPLQPLSEDDSSFLAPDQQDTIPHTVNYGNNFGYPINAGGFVYAANPFENRTFPISGDPFPSQTISLPDLLSHGLDQTKIFQENGAAPQACSCLNVNILDLQTRVANLEASSSRLADLEARHQELTKARIDRNFASVWEWSKEAKDKMELLLKRGHKGYKVKQMELTKVGSDTEST